MLELGIDEITIVLQLSPEIRKEMKFIEWEDYASQMIGVFVEKSGFNTVFGDVIPEMRAPAGYTIAYKFGEHNFYLAVAYHEMQVRMGVVIKFSARSLDYYCELSGLSVYELLQMIQDELYTVRLSRIDLTADYINENIRVTEIYNNFIKNKVGIFREHEDKETGKISYRKCKMLYQGYLKKAEVPTLYIGSTQSNSRLRIYDKKREQIETNGTKLIKAKNCKDWVRFEGVFKHEYAHQLSKQLLEIKNDNELANLIACTLIQKYRFMHIDNGVADCETEYSQLLINSISNQNFSLKSPTSRNYELNRNIAYLFNGSGVISTLYKIKMVWNDEAVSIFLKYIEDYLKMYIPNDDCRNWLRCNQSDYRRNYPEFNKFLETAI